jgi:hypothetical protein
MSPLAQAIVREIGDQPQQFADVVDAHLDVPWPQFLRAWGEVRAADVLTRDEDGRYLLKTESPTSGA